MSFLVTLTILTKCSGVSIVNFEQLNVGWVCRITKTYKDDNITMIKNFGIYRNIFFSIQNDKKTHFFPVQSQPILAQFSISIPPENIRKPKVF